MKARFDPMPSDASSAPFEELSVVRLSKSVEIAPVGYFPVGTLGTVVSVYGAGAMYDIEVEDPVHALLTLQRGDIEPVPELTRERIVAASAGLPDRPA